jgi:ABC-type transporter Mla MlaB component
VQNQISLPSELTIYSVGELLPQFLAWLKETQNAVTTVSGPDERLRVEAASVEDVDAAGVQLLLSVSNALALRGRTLQLVNASEPLSRACAALGASALMANADLTQGAQ